MTNLKCSWCGKEFERQSRFGRQPKFCKQACRQRAYESRTFEKVVRVK